jgi:hypothetical protein
LKNTSLERCLKKVLFQAETYAIMIDNGWQTVEDFWEFIPSLARGEALSDSAHWGLLILALRKTP